MQSFHSRLRCDAVMPRAQQVDATCAAALAIETPSESDTETFLDSDDELSDDFSCPRFRSQHHRSIG